MVSSPPLLTYTPTSLALGQGIPGDLYLSSATHWGHTQEERSGLTCLSFWAAGDFLEVNLVHQPLWEV